MRSLVKRVHTTRPFYFLLFLLSLQTFLIGIKVDGVSDIASQPWLVILVPLVLLGVAAQLVCLLVFSMRMSYRIGHASMLGLSQTMQLTVRIVTSGQRLAVLWLISTALLLTPLLIGLKADRIVTMSWWLALMPIFFILAALTATPLLAVCAQRRSFMWLASGAPLFILITALLVTAKIEHVIDTDWCVLFLPWWISEAFVLSASIAVCLLIHRAIVGWIISVCCFVYITCMIIIRTLLCADLGEKDLCGIEGQPVSFPATVILIPLYLIFLVVFNGLVYMTKFIPPNPLTEQHVHNNNNIDDVGDIDMDESDDENRNDDNRGENAVIEFDDIAAPQQPRG